MSNKIGIERNFYKDNKEILDVTMQIENIKKSENLILSPWIMKLSDLMGDKPKFDVDIEKEDQVLGNGISVYASNYYWGPPSDLSHIPTLSIIVKVPNDIVKKGNSYDCDILVPLYYAGEIEVRTNMYMQDDSVLLYSFRIKKIIFDETIIAPPSGTTTIPTHHARAIGQISMVYKDSKGDLNPVSHEKYCIYLGCVNGKQSISGGMIPNSSQKYDNCGISDDKNFIYLSSVYENLLNQDYDAKYEFYYGSNILFPFGYVNMGVFGGEIEEGSPDGPSQFNVFQVTDKISTDASKIYSQVFYDFPSYSISESWLGKYLTDCVTIANTGEAIGSGIEKKHATYHKNMFVLFSDKKIEENTLQSDIKYSDFKNLDIYKKNKTDKVSDYFSLKYDESGSFGPYIEVNMINAVNNGKTVFNDGKNLASIQIWYLDDVENGYTKEIDPFGLIQKFEYHPDNCYCHFVFGLNVKQSDYETLIGSSSSVKNIKIYLSLINKKDDRVFDQYHKAIGVLSNSAITKQQYSFKLWSPIYQQYESIENLSNGKQITVSGTATDYPFLDNAVITISRVSGDYIRIFSCGNVNIIYSSGIFWLEGKTDEYSTEKHQITITDSDYENDKISISFKYIYNEGTKKYDAEVYIKGSIRASIENTVPDGYVNLQLFGSAGASIQAITTFKLYSLDTVWFYKDGSQNNNIKRNFVPCGAVGLQDESNVFLLDKDRNDRVIITDYNGLQKRKYMLY